MNKKKEKVKATKKPLEFSKKIYILNYIFVVSVTTASFVLMFLSGKLGSDTSALTVIIPAVFAVLGFSNRDYFRKSQAENTLKIGKSIQDAKIDSQAVELAHQIMSGNVDGNGY